MTINLHTHTPRCHHAAGTERDYIERALHAGFKTLGFSDHAPMPFHGDYYSTFRMRPEETQDYVETLLRLREEYKSRIDILIGFEVEYYPALFDEFLKLIAPYPIDYLILGQHFIGNEIGEPYCALPTDDEAILERYVSQAIEGMQTGVFTYLAHPDVLPFLGSDAVYEKHMLRLCESAGKLNMPLEINGWGLYGQRAYPTERFFRLAGLVGNQVVFGLDAHKPEVIGADDIRLQAEGLAARCGIALSEDIALRAIHPRR